MSLHEKNVRAVIALSGAIILLVIYMLLTPDTLKSKQESMIRVISTMRVDNNTDIRLVEIDGKKYIIGSNQHSGGVSIVPHEK